MAMLRVKSDCCMSVAYRLHNLGHAEAPLGMELCGHLSVAETFTSGLIFPQQRLFVMHALYSCVVGAFPLLNCAT